MHSKIVAAIAALILLFALGTQRASAIPIFAQRYHFRCTQCHSVLPELDAYGNYFRSHGYRLPLPRHGTTIFAIRYQMAYAVDPAAGTRRSSPGGIVRGAADLGPMARSSTTVWAPAGDRAACILALSSALRCAYENALSVRAVRTAVDPIAGTASRRPAGVRLLSDACRLEQPAAGVAALGRAGREDRRQPAHRRNRRGRRISRRAVRRQTRRHREYTSFSGPELGLWLDQKLYQKGELEFDAGGEALGGSLHVLPTGRPAFSDLYQRYGLLAHGTWHSLDFQAEQWWGDDHDADGFLTNQHSAGGYVRSKYYPVPNAYLGIRYDASANPSVVRDWTYYAAGMIEPVRLLLQEVQPIPGGPPWAAR